MLRLMYFMPRKPLRLPCMTSSNIMRDSLTGALDTIEFEDFLGC